MLVNRPRGTNDILPGQAEKWRYLEEQIRQICFEYGFGEIRTPIFEQTELFQRGVGETTDVVEKEMYTFLDKGETSLTLRPEGTASTVRAFVENGLYGQPLPVKLYYLGPMFRYDRPQAGRFRQFHQFGVEVLGSQDPLLDAEVMIMAMDLYQRLGLSNLELHLNSVGCPVCRQKHRSALREFLVPRENALCDNCRRRLERNPMRVLDCKGEKCQEASAGAPATLHHLCPDCAGHFQIVREALDELAIPYVVNERLVRGLDYYTQTAFEIIAPGIGAQNSIGGGGRYDGLVEEIGGPPTPGVGFALGLERILLALELQGVELPTGSQLNIFISTLGAEARKTAFDLMTRLRRLGLAVNMDYLGRSLKAQMKQAGKSGAQFVVIVGGEELERQAVTVRDMAAGQQTEVALVDIGEFMAERLEGHVRLFSRRRALRIK
ncbi:MAG: histidine--tRNA ligase [Bacillota bacterium]